LLGRNRGAGPAPRRIVSASTSTRRSSPRRLTSAELRAVEREKARLSIELHDGVGQHLTGIAFLAKALANRLKSSDALEADSAEQIAQLTNEAISNIRALARGLRPVGPEDNALIVALGQLSRDIRHVYGIECRYGADEGATIASPIVSHHLFRIAQEAVHNAVKHGDRGRIGIDLAARQDQLVLTVTNPGRLKDPGVADGGDGPGIGMVSMRYRAQLIGARLSLENVRSHDVRLRVTINRNVAQTLREEGELHD
jgi:signal transduction histidine kinase